MSDTAFDPPFGVDPLKKLVDWLTAVGVSFLALVGTAVLSSPLQLSVLLFGFAGLISALSGSAKPTISALWLSVPFTVPLLAIHSILNPQFSVTAELQHVLPLRMEGFVFGLKISLRVITIFVVGAMWLRVDGEKMISDLTNIGVPDLVVAMAAQAIAMTTHIGRRIRVVYEAQQARGIKVGPGVFARASALPKIVLPLFVTLIVDSDIRARVLFSRGFGSGQASVWRPFTLDRSFWIACSLGLVIIVGGALL